MDITALRHQHASLERLIDLLGRAIAADDPRPIAGLRWQLARELLAHLSVEDKWLYPRLVADGGVQTADMARRFKAEMGGLAASFDIYMAQWTQQRIARDWSAFRKETLDLLAKLRVRIDREDHQLYPLAEQSGAVTPHRAA